MSTTPRRSWLIDVAAAGHLLIGLACLAFAGYALWAGSDAIAALLQLNRTAAPLIDGQGKQAADLATSTLSGFFLAAVGLVAGCHIAQGLPHVLLAVGLYLRQRWARVMGLVFAVLLLMEGAALAVQAPTKPALIVGLAFVVVSVVSFAGLLGPQASASFGAIALSPLPAPTGEPMAVSAASRPNLILATALILCNLGLIALALRPATFVVPAPQQVTQGADGRLEWRVGPGEWILPGKWPDTSNSYRERTDMFLDAAARGQSSRVLELLQLGAVVDDKNDKGETALMKAAANGHQGVVLLLLCAGANPGEADSQGKNTLMHAAATGRYGIARMLGGYDLDAAGLKSAEAQLNTLATNRKDGVLKAPMLILRTHKSLENGIPEAVFRAQDNEGKSAYMHAVVNGHVPVAYYLAWKSDVNAHDKKGHTAMHLAALQPTSFLWTSRSVQYHPPPNDSLFMEGYSLGRNLTRTVDGNEAWMVAAEAGNLPAVKMLLPTPAVAKDRLTVKNHAGKSGLDLAREAGKKDVVAYLTDLMARAEEKMK